MKKLKRFAANHPLGFTFVALILLFVLMGAPVAIAVGLLAYDITDVTPQVAGQIVATLGFLLLLWRFGWLAPAGITRLGSRRLWLGTLLILLYSGLSLLVAFFGTLSVDLSLNRGMAPVLANVTMAGIMEEILFRGLILYALVSTWGNSRRGLLVAVFVSAVLFGALHFVNLAGGQADVTALQALESFISGILYGALVLAAGSVWPAVVLHSGINLLANLAVLNIPGFAITVGQYLALVLLEIPLVLYGLYLLTAVNLRFGASADAKTVEIITARSGD